MEPHFEKLAVGTSLIPYVGPLVGTIKDIVGILASETEWKQEFAHQVGKQIDEKILKNNINGMDTKLRQINSTIDEMRRKIESKQFDERTNASMSGFVSTTYTEFDEMIIEITKENSDFKKFPLLAAPHLIELGLLVSTFEPTQIAFINRDYLSCEIRDGCLNFMSFVVAERLSKIDLDTKIAAEVRTVQYNRAGYGDQFDCTACSGSCLNDEFSTKAYEKTENCQRSYGLRVRHLVEMMFPIEQLDKTCNLKEGELTGN